MTFYYKIIGIPDDGFMYCLGYTVSKRAWLKNANGWKPSQLLFEKLPKKGEIYDTKN